MAEVMVRYDDLRLYCEKRHCGSVPLEYIKQMPTVGAEPEVRHGRWIEVTKHRNENGTILTDYECSECCAMVKDSNTEEIESERFCYNCGARMDATDTNVSDKGEKG